MSKIHHDTKYEVLRAVSLKTQGFRNATAWPSR